MDICVVSLNNRSTSDNLSEIMNKKKTLIIASVLIMLVPILLLMTGCPQHIDSLFGLKVTGDGNGGAIAVYEDTLGGNIYAQKISADGQSLWGEKGTLLGSSGSKTSYVYAYLNIISDDAGGAIIVWPDASQNKYQYTYHLTRIGIGGKMLWQRDFSYFNQMVSDGTGGAIIAYYSSTNSEEKNLTIVKIDTQGNYPWGINGASVPSHGYQNNTLQMNSDGSGGAIVVWEELESQPGSTPGTAKVTNRLLTQRINNRGNLLWRNGITFDTTPDGTWAACRALRTRFAGRYRVPAACALCRSDRTTVCRRW